MCLCGRCGLSYTPQRRLLLRTQGTQGREPPASRTAPLWPLHHPGHRASSSFNKGNNNTFDAFSVVYGERDRPTDSSAARMPFPGATMRSAVSWRSFFCTADSVGPWCVMLGRWPHNLPWKTQPNSMEQYIFSQTFFVVFYLQFE